MRENNMTKQEFMKYVSDHIGEYLPRDFGDAEIRIQEVEKKNGRMETGLVIRKADEDIAPQIYLDSAYEIYQEGADIRAILEKAADIRVQIDGAEKKNALEMSRGLLDYARMKNKLEINLCDREKNQERLKHTVHTEQGDFAAEYRVVLKTDERGKYSVAVTPQLLEAWGITVEQLHKDALQCEKGQEAVLVELDQIIDNIAYGTEMQNLLVVASREVNPFQPMYCLTNSEQTDGASLILQEDLLERVGDVIGDDYYILPSSIHETLLVPENAMMTAEELSDMVKEINRNVVAPEDRLSDHVQHYDRQTGVMENALRREERLEHERMMKDPIKEFLRKSAQGRPSPAKNRKPER